MTRIVGSLTQLQLDTSKQYHDEYRKAHKEKFNAYNREYYARNAQKLRDKKMEYRKTKKERDYWTRQYRKYGVSEELYEHTLDKQGRRCGICKIHVDDYGKRFDFDHAHVDGYDDMSPQQKRVHFRGLLCFNCNRGIGHFRDNIEYLEQAERYLYYGGVK